MDFYNIEKNISESTLNACELKSSTVGCNEIPGTIITTALDNQLEQVHAATQCSESPTEKNKRKKKEKEKEKGEISREVLLVAEIHTFDVDSASETRSKSNLVMTSDSSAQSTTNMLMSQIFSLPENVLKLSDDELSSKISSMVSELAKIDEEKINILGEFSRWLYSNYNDKRNPGKNTANEAIPIGRISLGEIIAAKAANNKDLGGVCNDISTAVAQVAQKLFPNDEVLVVNNGTHFGVLIHGKDKKNKIISGSGRIIDDIKDPLMDPAFPVTNSRILKLDGDTLKQIAVVDTESGVVLKKMIQGPTDPLTMGIDPSIVYADFKKEVLKKDKLKSYDLKAGSAETSNSNILILVVQSSKETEHSSSSTALSVMNQNIRNSNQNNVIIGFHSTFQKRLIQYQSPRLKIKGSAGGEVDLSYGIQNNNNPNSALSEIMPMSANLKLNQTIDFRTHPKNSFNPTAAGRFQVAEDFGSMNEGARQGTMPDPNAFRSVMKSMKYMGFSLNQVKADVNVDVPINKNLKSFSNLQYQGSNISQNFKVLSGFQVISDGGQKLMAYVGYMDTFKGYKTKSSLSTRPTGPFAGGGIKTKNGLEVDAHVQVSPGNANPVQANIGLKKTFRKTKKKKKSATSN